MIEVEINIYSDIYYHDVPNLILDIQSKEFNLPINLTSQPDLQNIPNFYQINKGNFWVATVSKTVVGTIALLDIGNHRGALKKMFVLSGHRGKEFGVGQQLLNTLFDWAKLNNFKEIFLGTTEKFIAAQRFYEKNGFKQIEKKTLPKEFPIMAVDVKFYKYVFEK